MAKKLYEELLKGMVKNAKKKNFVEVRKINDEYGEKVASHYHNPMTRLELECENCRTSCVMAGVPMFKDQRENLISDAKKRYSKIKKMLRD